jgi:regulator of sirC expression with transglutaminase-like and TPR domain
MMDNLNFEASIQQNPINLTHAALALAREVAYPQLDIQIYLQRLDHLAELACEVVPEGDDRQRALALSDFLFNQLRFQGNAANYDDPRNSYLNQVLDRRLGIPISLSAIYLDIAHRLHMLAEGIGMPGHFIIGVPLPGIDENLYLDPFHGGRLLSPADCLQLVEQSTGYQGEFRPEWLAPASTTRILRRMLFNLRNVYLQKNDWSHAQAVVERMAQLEPESPDHLRDLGVIHYQNGSLSKAVYYYEQYLLRAPQAEDAKLVRTSLQSAAQRLAARN